MTFVIKQRGDRSATIVCVYTCPEHGEFDAEVHRDENGDSPDAVMCGHAAGPDVCELEATWTPSPVFGKVRRVEVTRGKWEKPERKTYLDTRKLGEGQDVDEFRAERRKLWRDERMNKAYQEFKNR